MPDDPRATAVVLVGIRIKAGEQLGIKLGRHDVSGVFRVGGGADHGVSGHHVSLFVNNNVYIFYAWQRNTNSEAWNGMTTYTVEWTVTETVFPQHNREVDGRILSNAPATVNCGGFTQVKALSHNHAIAHMREVIGPHRRAILKIA